MFLTNPGVLASGAQGRTYDEWLAHIATRAPSAPILETNTAAGTGSGLRRVSLVAGLSGNSGLVGTPFFVSVDGAFSGSSPLGGVIRHAMPSEAAWSAQKAATRTILLELSSDTSNGTYTIPPLTRNGLSSSAFNLSEGTFIWFVGDALSPIGQRVGISYWDDTLGKPMSMFPRNGIWPATVGPVDYTAAGW